MYFYETPLVGAFVVETEMRADERGAFYRSFCRQEFQLHGLANAFVQCSISRNRLRGTLRGMHFQKDPKPEGKLVRCVSGSAYDVIVDLRRESPTFCRWFGIELNDSNGAALYVPPGFAHGFQTLRDCTDILYQMTEYYVPELADGVKWSDPAFGIVWPLEVVAVSERDRSFPAFV
jgi:dTDP-4-dehydrorhamnose 3,5-epimerase